MTKIIHKVTYTVAGREHSGDIIRKHCVTRIGCQRILNRYRNPGDPRATVTSLEIRLLRA